MPQVRVRFAPSPTGFLHVGGARTAIFNWLYARQHEGTFVLRIEDTDRKRSSDEMVRAILDGMEWLGLEFDEGPFFQSEAAERHAEDARRLLEGGQAYRCFCDPEELKRKGFYSYPKLCRRLTADESKRRAEGGEPFALRFKMPDTTIEWFDGVHGMTKFEGSELEDFVVLRSDGDPTYMLSVVSDDIEMRITHVIRGDDHLSNTPKQLLLYEALGQHPPQMFHLPLILGEDRKRLSKRHGAISVLDYRDAGYLPDAMFNFLALLGWSPGDDTERFTREELIRAFSFDGVKKSSAIFDLSKLAWLNGQLIGAMRADELIAPVRERLARAGLWNEAYLEERAGWFRRVLDVLKERARTFDDFVEMGRPYFDRSDDFEYDAKAVRKHLRGPRLEALLRAWRERLAEVSLWEATPLERALRQVADDLEIGAGKLIHPTRLALTGQAVSPGIFDVLELVGRERALARLDRLIGSVETLRRRSGAP